VKDDDVPATGNGRFPVFNCENITRYYDSAPVVQDISLEIPEGGFISLLGPSGAGKTTLFNSLAGVDCPDAGKVFLRGADITGICGEISYMLQKDLLLEYRTVLDNVILPLIIKKISPDNLHQPESAQTQPAQSCTENRVMTKKLARQYAASFFPRFGLEGYENKYPRQLSGGMRQRAALLRTCMLAKPVILLDEPFSALDAITRRRMQQWYCEIAEGMKLSTLFITHDVEEALLLSDTVYILNGKPGRITDRIDIFPKRPRDRDFSVSMEYAAQKRAVLEAIGLT
jgi:ABC-type nitrate/sulfonate/bicarbonate transport system ATPase subunit